MTPRLLALALIAETAVVIRTAYVAYRWNISNEQPWNHFRDLAPYYGDFAVVVAPWVFASLFIPACFIVLAIARRLTTR